MVAYLVGKFEKKFERLDRSRSVGEIHHILQNLENISGRDGFSFGHRIHQSSEGTVHSMSTYRLIGSVVIEHQIDQIGCSTMIVCDVDYTRNANSLLDAYRKFYPNSPETVTR